MTSTGPLQEEEDRLRKKFLAKFKRDPLLVPIPFPEHGQSPHPVSPGRPVYASITTTFITQVEEIVDEMKGCIISGTA